MDRMKSQFSTHLVFALLIIPLVALLGSQCLDSNQHEGSRDSVREMVKMIGQDKREVKEAEAAENKVMRTHTRNRGKKQDIMVDREDKEVKIERKRLNDKGDMRRMKKNRLGQKNDNTINSGGIKDAKKMKKPAKAKKKIRVKKIIKKTNANPVNKKNIKQRQKDNKVNNDKRRKVKQGDNTNKRNNKKDDKVTNNKNRKIKQEDKKEKDNKQKLDKEAMKNNKSIATSKKHPEFTFSNYLLAECGQAYKMRPGVAYLFTTDGGHLSRNCRTTFSSPRGTTIKLYCPVFSLHMNKCKRESLLLTESKIVKWPFCKTDVVDIETVGTSLEVHHKRKRIPRKKCPGSFLCEITLGFKDVKPPPHPKPPIHTRPPVIIPESTTTTRPVFTHRPTPPPTKPDHHKPVTIPIAPPEPIHPPTTQTDDKPFCHGCSAKDITITRIVGGVDVSEGEFNFIAHLKIDNKYLCGGSLISVNYVLTAAHCYGSGYKDTKVTLGEYNVNVDESYSQVMYSKDVILHPRYDDFTNDNDVALVKLDRPAELTDHVGLVCIATSVDTFNSNIAVLAGWGHTVYDGDYTSNILQKVVVHIITNKECADMYNDRDYSITDNMLCTYTSLKDACQGDSGGPLMVQIEDGTWVLAGLTSFGYKCAHVNSPGVFTLVSNYEDWIKEKISPVQCK